MSSQNAQWTVSLVRGDLLFRLQSRLGLIPHGSLGIGRRALFWALFAWLPSALWAWHIGEFMPSDDREPLLAHFGVNARLLLAIPLFIIAEGGMHKMLVSLLPRFVSNGIIPPEHVAQFDAVLKSVARLRDSVLPWLAIATLMLSFFVLTTPHNVPHELAWGSEQADHLKLGFGAWWYLYVGRTIFLVFFLGWIWRVALLFILFKRIASLPLSLVPTHPDRCGGLGFLLRTPAIFAPVVLGISTVFASGWAHQVVYHGAKIVEMRAEIFGFIAIVPLLFLSPFFAFMGLLLKTKKQALIEYGDLIGRHGRLVKERWIEGKQIEDRANLLDAPELGPIADTAAPYELIEKMRPLPLGAASVMPLLLAVILPMIILAALDLPIKVVLKSALKILI